MRVAQVQHLSQSLVSCQRDLIPACSCPFRPGTSCGHLPVLSAPLKCHVSEATPASQAGWLPVPSRRKFSVISLCPLTVNTVSPRLHPHPTPLTVSSDSSLSPSPSHTWQGNALGAAKQMSMYSGNVDPLGYQPETTWKEGKHPSPKSHTLSAALSSALAFPVTSNLHRKFRREENKVCVRKKLKYHALHTKEQ